MCTDFHRAFRLIRKALAAFNGDVQKKGSALKLVLSQTVIYPSEIFCLAQPGQPEVSVALFVGPS